jgi:adhesin/invasin
VIGTTGADGIATATLTNTAAGISAVTATLSNSANQTVDTTFVADGGTAVINDADFTVASGALANGTAPNALSATVRDGNGNLLGAGIDVTFTVTGAATPATQTVQTDANGVATANLVSLVAADNQVTATVGANTTAEKTSTFVADSSNLSTTNSTLVANPVNIVANDSDTSVVTLTLRDSNNNPVTGQTVAFTTTLGTLGAVSEGGGGVYTATLTAGTVAGVTDVTASVGGSAFGVAPASVTLTTPVTFTGISVNGHTFGKDKGFPTTGFENASFTLNMNGNPTDFVWTTNSANVGVNGNGVVTFNNEFSGSVTITATSNVDANVLTYTFTVENWFYPQQVGINWADALALCDVPGRQLPPLVGKMAQGENVRGIGSLLGEWGNMDTYGQLTSSPNGIAWTNQESIASPGQYFTAYFTGSNGGFFIEHETWNNDSNYVAICQRKP